MLHFHLFKQPTNWKEMELLYSIAMTLYPLLQMRCMYHITQMWSRFLRGSLLLQAAYSNQCITLAYWYYTNCLQGSLKEPLEAFKAARLFVPQKVQEMLPDATSIDSLTAFHCVGTSEARTASLLGCIKGCFTRKCRNTWLVEKQGRVSYQHGLRVYVRLRASNHHLQLQSEFFVYFRLHLVVNRVLPYKVTLKQLWCCSTTSVKITLFIVHHLFNIHHALYTCMLAT